MYKIYIVYRDFITILIIEVLSFTTTPISTIILVELLLVRYSNACLRLDLHGFTEIFLFFDDDWKEEVESKVEACGRMSGSCDDAFLDKGIEKAEIAKCLKKLKNNKTGGSDGLVGDGWWFWNGLLVRAVIFSCLA